MTAVACTYSRPSGSAKPLGALLILIAVLVIGALTVPRLLQPPTGRITAGEIRAIVAAANATAAQVVYHKHATDRHGVDAELVRRCVEQGPILQIWQKTNGSDRYHCLVKLPDGRIGDQLVQLSDDGAWHEITAFKRAEATLQQVEETLRREAVKLWALP
jgi:putative hemolysin